MVARLSKPRKRIVVSEALEMGFTELIRILTKARRSAKYYPGSLFLGRDTAGLMEITNLAGTTVSKEKTNRAKPLNKITEEERLQEAWAPHIVEESAEVSKAVQRDMEANFKENGDFYRSLKIGIRKP